MSIRLQPRFASYSQLELTWLDTPHYGSTFLHFTLNLQVKVT